MQLRLEPQRRAGIQAACASLDQPELGAKGSGLFSSQRGLTPFPSAVASAIDTHARFKRHVDEPVGQAVAELKLVNALGPSSLSNRPRGTGDSC